MILNRSLNTLKIIGVCCFGNLCQNCFLIFIYFLKENVNQRKYLAISYFQSQISCFSQLNYQNLQKNLQSCPVAASQHIYLCRTKKKHPKPQGRFFFICLEELIKFFFWLKVERVLLFLSQVSCLIEFVHLTPSLNHSCA